MLGRSDEDMVELECPECGARVEATQEQVRKGKVRCPRSHEFAVMGILHGPGGPEEPKR